MMTRSSVADMVGNSMAEKRVMGAGVLAVAMTIRRDKRDVTPRVLATFVVQAHDLTPLYICPVPNSTIKHLRHIPPPHTPCPTTPTPTFSWRATSHRL